MINLLVITQRDKDEIDDILYEMREYAWDNSNNEVMQFYQKLTGILDKEEEIR